VTLTVRRCRHCGKKTIKRARGLCFTCLGVPAVRDRYLPKSKSRYEPEPTEGELNALIASRWATMPSGWDDEPAPLVCERYGRAAVPVCTGQRRVMRKGPGR
jgi:ribosomal protein L37E